MYAEFSEKMGDFFKTVCKPLAQLAELNMNTLSKFSKQTNTFEKFTQAKRPEEFIQAQIELASSTAQESVKYWEEACRIWGDALSHANHKYTNTVREAVRRAESDNPSKF